MISENNERRWYTDADLERVSKKIGVTKEELEANVKAGEEFFARRQHAVLHQRMHETYAEMVKNLNTSMFGDDAAAPRKLKRSLREKLSDFSWRIRNAWDVLRGRADIC